MQGKEGAGLTTATAFSVPPESIGFWHERVKTLGLTAEAPAVSGDSEVLTLFDNDGMRLELVASPGDSRSGWDGVSDIPQEHALRGLHEVTLSERNLDPTASMLTNFLGMGLSSETAGAASFSMGEGGAGASVQVILVESKIAAYRPAEPCITWRFVLQTFKPWRAGGRS